MFVLCAVECVLKKEGRKRNRKGLRKSQIRAHQLEQTLHKNVLTPTSVRDASRQLTSPDLLQLFFLPLPSSQSFTAFEVKSHNNKKKPLPVPEKSAMVSEPLLINLSMCVQRMNALSTIKRKVTQAFFSL